MINPKINNEIIALWNEYFDKYKPGETPVPEKELDKVKAPMFYDEPKQGGILFIGMNPSSINSKVSKIIMKNFPDLKNPEKDLSWQIFKNRSDEDKIDRVVKIEEVMIKGEKPYPYFTPIIEITKSVELKNKYFQHIDLYLYRERDQSSFTEKIGKEYNKHNKFGKDQIKIFRKVLDSLSPEVIVVVNAKASKIFIKEYEDELKFDDSVGFHYFRGKIPIFFSGMLSGQRALDNHSKERLIWHIKKSISHNS